MRTPNEDDDCSINAKVKAFKAQLKHMKQYLANLKKENFILKIMLVVLLMFIVITHYDFAIKYVILKML